MCLSKALGGERQREHHTLNNGGAEDTPEVEVEAIGLIQSRAGVHAGSREAGRQGPLWGNVLIARGREPLD